MAKTRRFEMRMDEDLLGAVDAQRGSVSRAAFIVAAVEQALGIAPELRPTTPGPAPARAAKAERDARAAARRMPSPSLERFRS